MNIKKTENINNSGDAPCNHPSLAKEFAYGAPTGNYVCVQCRRLLSSIVGSAATTQIGS